MPIPPDNATGLVHIIPGDRAPVVEVWAYDKLRRVL